MQPKSKIAIVSSSLSVGGAERFASTLSFILDDLGYEVHHLIILEGVAYEYKGKLVNLGTLFSTQKGIFRAFQKGRYIADYLHKNNINLVLDNRSRPILIREIFTKWIYGNRTVYYMVHSANLDIYFPKSIFWTQYLYAKAAKMICVSKGIEELVQNKYQLKNTLTIYNPITITAENQKPMDAPDNYFLFYGRLEEKIKNFSLLLEGFWLSKVYENGFKLLIIGDGSSKELLEKQIQKYKLENIVTILPAQKEIFAYVEHAHATVLTSHFEGFPMVLVESLALGTPVLSVDCKTGPNEIVQHEKNGLLIENNNPTALSNAFQKMVDEEENYWSWKNNAKQSVSHVSTEIIAEEWKKLLSENISG